MTLRAIRARLLVAAQMIAIIALAITTPRPPWGALTWGFLLSGGALGAWSVAVMRRSRLRVLPDVHPQATLITGGPYRRIRHPMYSALLLVGLGAWSVEPTLLRFGFLIALVVVLALKIRHEEDSLRRAFVDYEHYAARTKRLCPCLW